MKLDAFHCALLVAIVLLAVYGFGRFKEGVSDTQRGSGYQISHWYPTPGDGSRFV